MIMKAIVVNGPGDMQLVERPMPEIKEPNQVLVKVHAAGICGSDVHVYHGSNPYAKYPVVLGHEGSGEVIAVGEGVTDLKWATEKVLAHYHLLRQVLCLPLRPPQCLP